MKKEIMSGLGAIFLSFTTLQGISYSQTAYVEPSRINSEAREREIRNSEYERNRSNSYPYNEQRAEIKFGRVPENQPGDRGRTYSNFQDRYIRGDAPRVSESNDQRGQREYNDYLRRYPGIDGRFPGTNKDSSFDSRSIFYRRQVQESPGWLNRNIQRQEPQRQQQRIMPVTPFPQQRAPFQQFQPNPQRHLYQNAPNQSNNQRPEVIIMQDGRIIGRYQIQ